MPALVQDRAKGSAGTACASCADVVAADANDVVLRRGGSVERRECLICVLRRVCAVFEVGPSGLYSQRCTRDHRRKEWWLDGRGLGNQGLGLKRSGAEEYPRSRV